MIKIRIDGRVLEKTTLFRPIFENPKYRDLCPDISIGLGRNFDSTPESGAIGTFASLGVCVLSEKISFSCQKEHPQECICFSSGNGICKHLEGGGRCKAKVVDLITGGTDSGKEYVFLVECKFNVSPQERPDKTLAVFYNWNTFKKKIVEKFLVTELWKIHGTPMFFALFREDVSEQAKRHFNKLKMAEDDNGVRMNFMKKFFICGLAEFRDFFA